MRCRSNRHTGFTLVELMVVLAILSVLAALAYPAYTAHVTRARRAEGQVALLNAMQQQEHHRALHHSYLPFSRTAPVEGVRWWSGSDAASSAYELEAQACPGRALRDCVQLSARPGSAHVDARFRDPACGVLTLSSTGEQGADGRRCWP